jgi:hypothetical protein
MSTEVVRGDQRKIANGIDRKAALGRDWYIKGYTVRNNGL